MGVPWLPALPPSNTVGIIGPVKDNPGVITRPPLIYLGALALGLGLHAAFRIPVLRVTVARTLGVLLIAGAVALVVPAFRAMARAGTSFRTGRPTTLS